MGVDATLNESTLSTHFPSTSVLVVKSPLNLLIRVATFSSSFSSVSCLPNLYSIFSSPRVTSLRLCILTWLNEPFWWFVWRLATSCWPSFKWMPDSNAMFPGRLQLLFLLLYHYAHINYIVLPQLITNHRVSHSTVNRRCTKHTKFRFSTIQKIANLALLVHLDFQWQWWRGPPRAKMATGKVGSRGV